MDQAYGDGAPLNTGTARLLGALAVLLLLLMGALLLEAAPAAAQAMAEEMEPGGPRLRLMDADGASLDAVMLDSRLELRIAGLLAQATLEQRFRNTSSSWREAEYLLPLPADAAVRSMELRIGERRILGEIREREAARQVYDAARRAGQRTALLEQQRPNLFTTRVANVGPQGEVVVRIELLVPVSYLDGQFSLRFPTTLTPRYIPGAPLVAAADWQDPPAQPALDGWMDLDGSGWAYGTDQVVDAALVSARQHVVDGRDDRPLNPLRLEVHLDAGFELAELDALYHDLNITRSGTAYRMALRDGVVEMDRDLVMRWRPIAAAAPQAALFRETFDGESFALLMLLPPQNRVAAAQRLPRELLLVLDVSGSMQGEPIRQARASVLHAIDALAPGDRVNLILFNDGTRQIYDRSRPVNDRVREELRAIVSRIQAGGGTEMLPALRAALRMPQPDAMGGPTGPLRQLLFITDGAVGNEAALLSLIDAERGAARIYTVGIGAAPNGYFMRRAADVGRGEALFIATAAEVAPQLDGLFRRIATPMVRDLRVEWPEPVEAFPSAVPDLYAGQPLVQAVRLLSSQSSGTVRVSGRLLNRAWSRELPLESARPADGVATHWARRKQTALLDGLLRGEARDVVRAAVLPLALRFSLASPFTSFVAREQQPLRLASAATRPAMVPNTRPQGQAPQRFAFPQTATTAAAKLYLGLLCAFAALITWVMTRREAE